MDNYKCEGSEDVDLFDAVKMEIGTSKVISDAEETTPLNDDRGRKGFKCELCDFSTFVRCKLICHSKSSHNKNIDHKCDQCQPEDLACPHCKQSYLNKGHLNRHIKTAHIEFKCWKCDFSCSAKSILSNHVRRIHDIYNCDQSNTEFPDKQTKRADKTKDYKCGQCEYAANHQWHLSNHVNKVHGSEYFMYTCNRCHDKFPSQRELKLHEKAVHGKIKPYKCENCDLAFSRKSKLDLHARRAHGLKGFKSVIAESVDILSSSMEILVNNEVKQEEEKSHDDEHTDDPINISTKKKPRPDDVTTSVHQKTFSRDQIYKFLQIDDCYAGWESAGLRRKKAAISIAHCGRINLQDLTLIIFQDVSVGKQGISIKHPQGTTEFVIPINRDNDPCLGSFVTMYLNCLRRAPRPGNTIFNPAFKDELCNLGQEVAILLGLDHPELYTGDCFTPGLNEDKVN